MSERESRLSDPNAVKVRIPQSWIAPIIGALLAAAGIGVGVSGQARSDSSVDRLDNIEESLTRTDKRLDRIEDILAYNSDAYGESVTKVEKRIKHLEERVKNGLVVSRRGRRVVPSDEESRAEPNGAARTGGQ